MFDDELLAERNGADAFSELDDHALEEWDSLKDLLSDLADRERVSENSGSFGVPALMGDGDGIARWVLAVGNVRRLSDILRLRQELPRDPWCIAARVIEIGPDRIRVGITTTMRVSHDQLQERVDQIIRATDGTTTDLEPVMLQSNNESWLTVDEAAHRLGAKVATVRGWVESGLFVTRQIETASGTEWRIRLRQRAAQQAVGV
ncbi:MAG TPA: helix-turn-helix domain-containing protein [Nitrolancea sp.]|jgi:hypothetical protein|nr:helix-turn-helix domain-containing protein [Nitrolancea sp.]